MSVNNVDVVPVVSDVRKGRKLWVEFKKELIRSFWEFQAFAFTIVVFIVLFVNFGPH